MHIHIRAIGKASEKWHESGIKTYTERISRFCTLSEKIYATPKRQKSSNVDKTKKIEHQFLTENLQDAYIIALDETGKAYNTQNFANRLDTLMQHHSKIIFVLGGPDGLHSETREKANMLLSLSAFTLPHILARLMLYEQIYRALTILNNHPYHRA